MTKKKLQLLDIFSYSCMNCLRSLEYIKQLDARYRKRGLETIIIHPPEWAFEKKSGNVIGAAKRGKIKIPIILDRDKRIIKKLNVDFWPAQILVKEKKIIYRHIGEGNYKILEKRIMKELGISSKPIFKKEPTYSKLPTIYAGRKKHSNITKSRVKKFGIIHADKYKLKGEYLELDGRMEIMAKGRKASFVAESSKPVKAKITIDGKTEKYITIQKPRLYTIAEQNDGIKKITIEAKKLRIYSFSFE